MLTVSAVAQQLALKEPTIRVWIKQGRIAHVKLGRAVRIPKEEVARIILDNLKAADKFIELKMQTREDKRNAASVSASLQTSATVELATNIDRTAANVSLRPREAVSSEDPVTCAQVAAIKALRVETLVALSNDPFLPTQTDVLPSQNKLLRKLEAIGLALRAHASECDGCYLDHHLNPVQVRIELDAPGGAK